MHPAHTLFQLFSPDRLLLWLDRQIFLVVLKVCDTSVSLVYKFVGLDPLSICFCHLIFYNISNNDKKMRPHNRNRRVIVMHLDNIH